MDQETECSISFFPVKNNLNHYRITVPGRLTIQPLFLWYEKTVFDASHWREINMYMFFPSEINISELECQHLQYVYRNRGHPLQTMKTNQIGGRTETVNSNIVQSSPSNVRYKSMKSLLMMLTAVLLINKLSSSNFYYFRIQLYSALSMG